MAEGVSPEELATLLDRHGPALELFAAQWTNAPDDCVQDAFLQLVRQRRRPDNVVAWLYRVVRNRAISLRRSQTRRARHESAVAGGAETWFESTTASELDGRYVRESLVQLPLDQREVVVARIWGGLSFEEIGVLVGVSRSSAHRRYDEALQALRNKLRLPWPTNELT